MLTLALFLLNPAPPPPPVKEYLITINRNILLFNIYLAPRSTIIGVCYMFEPRLGRFSWPQGQFVRQPHSEVYRNITYEHRYNLDFKSNYVFTNE